MTKGTPAPHSGTSQPRLELVPALFAVSIGRLATKRSIELLPDRVFGAGEAVGNQADLASHRLQERIDDRRCVIEDDPVLDRRALERDTRRLGSAPALTIVDSPGMDHDHGRPVCPQPVRHLDDPPGVIGEPPGADLEIGIGIVDQDRGLEPGDFADGLDKLREIVEDGPGIRNRFQGVLINACGFIAGTRGARSGSARRSDRQSPGSVCSRLILSPAGGLVLEKAEQVAYLFGNEFLIQRFGHQRDVRLLHLLDLRAGEPGALALGVAERDHVGRLLDDQAAQDASVPGGEMVCLVFLADDAAGSTRLTSRKSRSLPVGIGQVGSDRLPFALKSMTGGTSSLEESVAPVRGRRSRRAGRCSGGGPRRAAPRAWLRGSRPSACELIRRGPGSEVLRIARAGRASPRRPAADRDRSRTGSAGPRDATQEQLRARGRQADVLTRVSASNVDAIDGSSNRPRAKRRGPAQVSVHRRRQVQKQTHGDRSLISPRSSSIARRSGSAASGWRRGPCPLHGRGAPRPYGQADQGAVGWLMIGQCEQRLAPGWVQRFRPFSRS